VSILDFGLAILVCRPLDWRFWIGKSSRLQIYCEMLRCRGDDVTLLYRDFCKAIALTTSAVHPGSLPVISFS
jgi:hypothetical protein